MTAQSGQVEQPRLRVLALGAGVQSTVVLLASCEGVLPKLDVAIFADPEWERPATYVHADWLADYAGAHNIPVYRIRRGSIREDALRSQVRGVKGDGQRWASMPYFTRGFNGERGMIRRQCTKECKIRPIERFIKRELLSLRPRQRAPLASVELWFGISADEQRRVRLSNAGWKIHRYPLIEDLPLTRAGCIDWLLTRGFEVPPRSACVACPFQRNSEWRELKRRWPAEWKRAIEFDQAIRHCGGMRGDVFVHEQRVPLDEANLDEDQGELWEQECLGYCGN
jgi:hypothetical protein